VDKCVVSLLRLRYSYTGLEVTRSMWDDSLSLEFDEHLLGYEMKEEY